MRTRILAGIGLALLALLAACKPPRFDQQITCPLFNAMGVTVYDAGDRGFLVLYPDPDRHTVVVSREACVISRVGE